MGGGEKGIETEQKSKKKMERKNSEKGFGNKKQKEKLETS